MRQPDESLSFLNNLYSRNTKLARRVFSLTNDKVLLSDIYKAFLQVVKDEFGISIIVGESYSLPEYSIYIEKDESVWMYQSYEDAINFIISLISESSGYKWYKVTGVNSGASKQICASSLDEAFQTGKRILGEKYVLVENSNNPIG